MKYIGLAIAVAVAIGAAFLVLQASNKEDQLPAQAVEISGQTDNVIVEVNVYIAAVDIPVGSVIDANMITTRPWPQHLVVEGFVVGPEEGKAIINTVARAGFKRNEPINKVKLVNPDDPNFLAGELPKGMRLVTMSADEISAVAGFVFPGDRVDVLITHKILREGFSEEDLFEEDAQSKDLIEEVTEMLLTDVRVLAVDQRATAGVANDKGITVPRSVSLEMPLQDAQRLRLAQEVGKVSLALRSLQDKDEPSATEVTRPKNLSSILADEEQGDVKKLGSAVRVIRGTQLEEKEKEKKK